MSHLNTTGDAHTAGANVKHGSPRDVEAWLDSLCELDAEAWRAVGRAYVGVTDASVILDAQRALTRALSREQADVDVWMLRDQIETICHVAASRCGDVRRIARRELLAGRVAAEWATLAIAFGDRISPTEATLLCSPFADLLRRSALRLA